MAAMTLIPSGDAGAAAARAVLASSAPLASSYSGTAHNLTYDVTSALALTEVAESANGTIVGQVVVQPPLYGSGPFLGSLSDGHLTFTETVTGSNPAGETSASFVGEVSADGRLAGTYVTHGESTQTGTWEVAPGPAGPAIATSMTLAAVSGAVTFRLPDAASFSRLVGAITVPNGTEVNTIAGRAEITVATGGTPAEETALLYGGEFVAHQDSSAPYETHFVLSQPLSGCGATAARVAGSQDHGSAQHGRSSTTRRHLWAHDSGGDFGTTGRYVSTTVEGTQWLTTDTCQSSTVQVTEGVVTVSNLITGRTFVVHAGGRYATRATAHNAGGPLAAVASYWREVDAHDFAAAYRDLAPDAIAQSESQFIASERGYGVQSARFRGQVSGESASSAVVHVVSLITHDHAFGCRTWSGSYAMARHGSRWLIARADLTIRSCGR
jgi:hypothetical protein